MQPWGTGVLHSQCVQGGFVDIVGWRGRVHESWDERPALCAEKGVVGEKALSSMTFAYVARVCSLVFQQVGN